MAAFRRRLASGALVLIALQLALLFAAPMACCQPKMEATQVKKAEAEQCPLHKSKELGSQSEAQNSHCRMMCDAPHGPQFLLGAIGILAAPGSTHIELISRAMPAVTALTTTSRPVFPDAPPPRLL